MATDKFMYEQIPTDDCRSRRCLAGLWALTILLAGILLYPDTYADAGLRLGSLRLSPLSLVFAVTAPPIVYFIFSARKKLTLSLLDAVLIGTSLFLVTRGLLAVSNPNAAALLLAYFAYAGVAYYGSATLAQNAAARRVLFTALVVLSLIIAVYAMIEFLFNRNFLFADITSEKVPIKNADFHRSGSTLGHPTALGMLMVQALPFLLLFFVESRNLGKKTLWGLGILAVVMALIVSFAKGSWITAGLLGLAAIIWLVKSQIKHKWTYMSLAIAVVMVSGSVMLMFYNTLKFNVLSETRQNESFNTRIILWEKGAQNFLAHPLFGVGLQQGGAAIFKENFTAEEQEIMEGKALPVDNLYLTIFVEGGIVGAALVLLAACLLLKNMAAAAKSSEELRMWLVPAAISMAAVLINGMTIDSLLFWPAMVVFWLCAGLFRAISEVNNAGLNGSLKS
ncbi:MAG: O-antigen ligase family protein [Thermoleophilia bacterium]|nr:O-antigen ligase family protein [Thermoleophilia bacterium]